MRDATDEKHRFIPSSTEKEWKQMSKPTIGQLREQVRAPLITADSDQLAIDDLAGVVIETTQT